MNCFSGGQIINYFKCPAKEFEIFLLLLGILKDLNQGINMLRLYLLYSGQNIFILYTHVPAHTGLEFATVSVSFNSKGNR